MSTLDPAEARRRFTEGRVARMGTVGADGRPHVVPVVFAVDGDAVFSLVDAKPKRSPNLKRLANIAANPRVSLLVDRYEEDWRALWWVRVDGTASVEEGPDRDRAIELLGAKYDQYREWNTPFGPAVVVRVDRWSSWSFSP
ncbi:MAG: TIGR03668 family PPOX class F420-dependent oxidoreductase [Actinomycetota bacterium]|nr:TIGR03668 family PPOX class F420-dependent oxidoreductase [Actinomycetota bacterium]